MAAPTTLPTEVIQSLSLSKESVVAIGKRLSDNTYGAVAGQVGATPLSLGGTSLVLTSGPRAFIWPNKAIITDVVSGAPGPKWFKLGADIAVGATSAAIEAALYTLAANDSLRYTPIFGFTNRELTQLTSPDPEARTVEFRNWAGESFQIDDGLNFAQNEFIVNVSPLDWRIQQLMTWFRAGGTYRDVDFYVDDVDGGGKTAKALLTSVGRIRQQGQPVLTRFTVSPYTHNPYFKTPAGTAQYYSA